MEKSFDDGVLFASVLIFRTLQAKLSASEFKNVVAQIDSNLPAEDDPQVLALATALRALGAADPESRAIVTGVRCAMAVLHTTENAEGVFRPHS
jgi:hypothetical protein